MAYDGTLSCTSTYLITPTRSLSSICGFLILSGVVLLSTFTSLDVKSAVQFLLSSSWFLRFSSLSNFNPDVSFPRSIQITEYEWSHIHIHHPHYLLPILTLDCVGGGTMYQLLSWFSPLQYLISKSKKG